MHCSIKKYYKILKASMADFFFFFVFLIPLNLFVNVQNIHNVYTLFHYLSKEVYRTNYLPIKLNIL